MLCMCAKTDSWSGDVGASAPTQPTSHRTCLSLRSNARNLRQSINGIISNWYQKVRYAARWWWGLEMIISSPLNITQTICQCLLKTKLFVIETLEIVSLVCLPFHLIDHRPWFHPTTSLASNVKTYSRNTTVSLLSLLYEINIHYPPPSLVQQTMAKLRFRCKTKCPMHLASTLTQFTSRQRQRWCRR